MKTYHNILKSAALLAVASLTMASCDDWLTVHPQTQIVEENFWEDKTDLEGVRYGAYKNLADQVEKMIVWGDLRSDLYLISTIRTNDQKHRDNFTQIRQANIDTTMSYYDWSGMYTTIGYCNKVLQHGPEILAKDKQFTSSEWRQMEAEMKTMRALCYFYLVRAFKNVPYTTKVVNSDADIEYFPQLPAVDVMDSLITDVESIAGNARNRFVSRSDTKGMITNTAVYALLSDMYLWRASLLQNRTDEAGSEEGEGGSGEENAESAEKLSFQQRAIQDYENCIRCSEMSLSKLKDQFDEETKSSFINRDDYISWGNAPLFNGKEIDFMYSNDIRNAARGDVDLDAYLRIFQYKNSHEGIFELQFSPSDGRKNTFPQGLWGNSSSTTLVSSSNEKTKTDMREWLNGWTELLGSTERASDPYVLKWCAYNPVFRTEGLGTKDATVAMSLMYDEYLNWIVWRLSDMLLNNAEARACLADLNVNKADNVDVCRKLLRMVNRRWWIDLTLNDVTVETNLASRQTYDKDDAEDKNLLKSVMDTRKMEFAAEGKRWFDLVRYAERLSTSDDDATGMQTMFNTFMSTMPDYEAARSRCENLWGLYCPIYYMECKAYRAGGSSITQNPVWNKSKYDRK